MEMDRSIFLILVCACASSFSITSVAGISRKELRNNDMNQEPVIRLGGAVPPDRVDPSRVTQLSWRPRVFLYRGFLSDEDCDHLIYLGHDNQNKSRGSIVGSGTSKESPKSADIYLDVADETTARIEEKISAWTFLPKVDGKPFQILHFGPEDSKQNYNYFSTNSTILHTESVLATVILYLSNVSQGGQILFPESKLESSKLKHRIWSDCTKSSNNIRPTKGNAILFFNLHPNATLDNSSSHARCPVLEGDMWAATKYYYVKAMVGEKTDSQNDDDGCTDEDESCPRWAAIGECNRNPVFMIGSPDYYGTCRRSCNVC